MRYLIIFALAILSACQPAQHPEPSAQDRAKLEGLDIIVVKLVRIEGGFCEDYDQCLADIKQNLLALDLPLDRILQDEAEMRRRWAFRKASLAQLGLKTCEDLQAVDDLLKIANKTYDDFGSQSLPLMRLAKECHPPVM